MQHEGRHNTIGVLHKTIVQLQENSAEGGSWSDADNYDDDRLLNVYFDIRVDASEKSAAL